MCPKQRLLSLGLLSMAALTACHLPKDALKYPDTRKENVVDVLHGTAVPDPYRWLEDDNAPETEAWVTEQNRLTFDYLDQIPERTAIRERLTELWNYEKYGVPFREGGRYFFTRNDGLQNQSVLYVNESLEAEPRVLLDPNKLSADGTIALRSYAISHDGRLMAYGLSHGGSDWQEWKIRNTDTGEDLTDHLKWVKFSGASWSPDNEGFYYSRYDEPADGDELKGQNYHQKVWYHKVGTPQSADRLIYDRPDQKEWGFGADVTDDGNFLIISVWKGTDRRNRVFYRDLRQPDAAVVELLNDFDASYTFVDNVGDDFLFFTDLDAPHGRVIAIDTTRPAKDQWREIIPEGEDTLRSVNLLNDSLVGSYLHDAHSRIRIFSRTGQPIRDVELPGIGSADGFGGRRTDRETFYSFSGFTVPGRIYRYDLATGTSTVYRQPTVDFNPDAYETRQVFFKSRDGTRIPMFITHRRGLKLNGTNPVYLYGYGGFNISLTPRFSLAMLVWMERGGVYAQPTLRGGGEYGEEWHRAGTKHEKQNVFDDFIGAAEWLIENKYTSPNRLAIAGGSNGGLLVGACMLQRPELFGAALPAVGVLDMLRFHKFTIGWAWTSDYGSPDDPEEFRSLYAYSPFHNLKPGVSYPPTLITTGDHDDRVVPAHSFKFAARLQEFQSGSNPALIRIETKAGHGAGKPTDKIIAEIADKLGFLVKELKVPTPPRN
jgi:prolyl oligopeptidase